MINKCKCLIDGDLLRDEVIGRSLLSKIGMIGDVVDKVYIKGYVLIKS